MTTITVFLKSGESATVNAERIERILGIRDNPDTYRLFKGSLPSSRVVAEFLYDAVAGYVINSWEE